MNPYLLYEQRDFQYRHRPHNQTVAQDLQLDLIIQTMAQGNDDLSQTAREIILQSEVELDTIMYRQEVLQDGLRQPKFMYGLYEIASNMDQEAQSYREQLRPTFGASGSIRSQLQSALKMLALILTKLSELREHGSHYQSQIRSRGMKSLFHRVEERYSDFFLRRATEEMNRLTRANMENRLTVDVKIGDGLKGSIGILRELETVTTQTLLERMLKTTTVSSTEFSFSEIQESALDNVLKIIKRFIEQTLKFFDMLRLESGFYTGGVHLYEALQKRECELSFPEPFPLEERVLQFTRLKDPGLVLHANHPPISNDLEARDKQLFVITGANQGGKTTYIRTIGVAQLMMQCGLFVLATSFQANVCDRMFTHFTKEEDKQMVSGRLDDELARLDRMMDDLTVHSLLLMNEPFLSTTEREGSSIAKDLLSVCYEQSLKVLIVTHFYELANWCYESEFEHALFMLPERDSQGNRTYKLVLGKPEPTSYGEELFRSVMKM